MSKPSASDVLGALKPDGPTLTILTVIAAAVASATDSLPDVMASQQVATVLAGVAAAGLALGSRIKRRAEIAEERLEQIEQLLLDQAQERAVRSRARPADVDALLSSLTEEQLEDLARKAAIKKDG